MLLQDTTALVLAAEAYMNLSPWDYYTAEGDLRPNARVAEHLLLQALKINPSHVFALHLHIHIAEAGAATNQGGAAVLQAGRALRSANTLAELNAQHGHLMHMPSHLYLR